MQGGAEPAPAAGAAPAAQPPQPRPPQLFADLSQALQSQTEEERRRLGQQLLTSVELCADQSRLSAAQPPDDTQHRPVRQLLADLENINPLDPNSAPSLRELKDLLAARVAPKLQLAQRHLSEKQILLTVSGPSGPGRKSASMFIGINDAMAPVMRCFLNQCYSHATDDDSFIFKTTDTCGKERLVLPTDTAHSISLTHPSTITMDLAAKPAGKLSLPKQQVVTARIPRGCGRNQDPKNYFRIVTNVTDTRARAPSADDRPPGAEPAVTTGNDAAGGGKDLLARNADPERRPETLRPSESDSPAATGGAETQHAPAGDAVTLPDLSSNVPARCVLHSRVTSHRPH